MLKIITVNIETNKHYSKVLPFLDKENPDIICLQEAPELFAHELQKRGYQTAYAPMLLKNIDDTQMSIGIMMASKHQFSPTKNYFHRNEAIVTLHDKNASVETIAAAYLYADIEIEGTIFSIATTHMIDTENGKEDADQIEMTQKLLTLVAKEKPHVLCGDFNMPRGYNRLHNEMTKYYEDTIPLHYKSSLDRNLHRLRDKILNAPIFDIYVVDYIFTQSPYQASNVRLQFGVSDHAAVVATIDKIPTQP